MADLPDAFVREAESRLRELGDGLLAIESGNADQETVGAAFRTAHGLKGDCAAVGLDEVRDLAHAIEDVLAAVRDGNGPPDAALDETLAAVDDAEAIVRAGGPDRTTVDPESRTARLRELLESTGTADAERAGDAITGVDAAAATSDDSGTAQEGSAPPDGIDPDVAAALDGASEFDDLDALDPRSGETGGESEELSGWGRFDTGSAEDDAEPEGGTAAGGGPEAMCQDEEDEDSDGLPSFESVRASVDQTDDIDTLQADIDAADFGEFDDADDATIRDLLELDPATGVNDTTAVAPSGRPADGTAGGADGPSESDRETIDDGAGDTSGAADPAAGDVGDWGIGSPAGGSIDGVDADADSTSTAEGTGDGMGDPAATGASDWKFGTIGDDTEADAGESPAADTAQTADIGADADGTAADEPADAFGLGDADRVEVGMAADAPAAGDDGDDGLPDLDTLLGDVEEGASEAGAEDPVETFGTASSVETLEARFGGLLDRDGDDGGTAGLLGVQPVAPTIETSDLDWTGGDDRNGGDGTNPGGVDGLSVDVDHAETLLTAVETLTRTHRRLERALGGDGSSVESDATDGVGTPDAAGPALQEARTALVELGRTTATLRETVVAVRSTPLSAVADRLPRVARSAARGTDIRIDVGVDVGDARLDRRVVDRLGEPLTHLVRNAVAHGIEPPDEREAAGKPREGCIEIRAERVRDRVAIEVRDDGRGLDTDALGRVAVERGLVDAAEVESMPAAAIHDLAFRPGVSTAGGVTELSGRGVGMDAVREAAAELNGTVEVESVPGEGTTVRLLLPVAVSITEALLVESGDELFAVPLSAVASVVDANRIETTPDGHERLPPKNEGRAAGAGTSGSASAFDPAGGAAAVPEDWPPERTATGTGTGVDPDGTATPATDPVPVWRLAATFDTDGSREGTGGRLLRIRPELREIAIHCDRVVDSREIVVRPYESVLADVPGIGGTTTRPNGKLINVIDVNSLGRDSADTAARTDPGDGDGPTDATRAASDTA